MFRFAFIVGLVFSASVGAVRAEPVCVDGICYPSEEAAVHAERERPFGLLSAHAAVPVPTYRVAEGYRNADAFLAFLRDEPVEEPFDERSFAVVVLLVLIAGMAANLTPCVLPLAPVTLALVGVGWRRGAAYGLGIALAYGALGFAAAFGGLAFGALQASPWFNAGTAAVFLFLALAVGGWVNIDFDRWRIRSASPFLLGVGAATLAGACVEPVLLATLLYASSRFAAGETAAAALPFVLGFGMGLPWPFAAAGLAVFPKPGKWMIGVRRAFAAVLVVLAVHYALLAAGAFRAPYLPSDDATEKSDTAQKLGRDVLYEIGADWCGSCAAMEKRVLSDPRVRAELAGCDVRRVRIADFGDLKRHPFLKDVPVRGLPAFVYVPAAEE